MAILHKIKAYLYDNFLTKDNPNDFIARTVSERSLNVKQICEAAVSRSVLLNEPRTAAFTKTLTVI